jgi:hypothetical protein
MILKAFKEEVQKDFKIEENPIDYNIKRVRNNVERKTSEYGEWSVRVYPFTSGNPWP